MWASNSNNDLEMTVGDYGVALPVTFDSITIGALVMFKSKNGLTGETCDPQTWAALLEV